MSDLAAVKEIPILDVAHKLGLEVNRQGFARCFRPEAHTNGDANPSLHLDPKSNRFYCHVCQKDVSGSVVDLVMKKQGIEFSAAVRWLQDQFHLNGNNGNGRTGHQNQLTAEYDYTDENGIVLFQVVRYEPGPDGNPKGFKQRRPNGEGGWIEGPGCMTGCRLVLYHLPEVLSGADPILLVEGEKAVDYLRERGFNATCNPMGGGKWRPEYSEALRGRDVVLIPDNDTPGRKHVEQVARSLQGVAKRVRILDLQGRTEKEGADDWLQNGHTAEELRALIEKAPEWEPKPEENSEPQITVLDPESVRVILAGESGPVEFTFLEIEKRTRDLSATLKIRPQCEGNRKPYSQRINLQSFSARESCKRELAEVYGKEYSWGKFLSEAFSMAEDAFLGIDNSKRLDTLHTPRDLEFALQDIIPADGPTIIFGAGASGKTYLALSIALAVCQGIPWLGRVCQRRNVLFVDYETGEGTFAFRSRRILSAWGKTLSDVPGFFYWNRAGVPLLDQADAIRRSVEKNKIGFLVVDHLAAASAGEPEKSEAALMFDRAVRKIGLPVLGLAHVTGQEEQEPKKVHKPFGSIFYQNIARRTWFVQRNQNQESDVANLGLFCKKINDGKWPRDFGVTLTFTGNDGPVYVSESDIQDTPGLNQTRDLKYVARDIILRDGPQTTNELAEKANTMPNTMGATMRREIVLFRNIGDARGGPGKTALWDLRDKTANTTPNQEDIPF